MRRRYTALALTLALSTGCAAVGDVASPTNPGNGTASAELVATVGALGPLLQPALDRVQVRDGAAASAGTVAQLVRAHATYAARVEAGDPFGAYAAESRLRLEAAERIAAQFGGRAIDGLLAACDSARDRLRARLRDGTGGGVGPGQDRLRLADRLCDASAAAVRAGRFPAALDYAAQALETASGWQGPPDWAARFGDSSPDRLQLRDGSCDSDGDGIPDRVRERARDGSGSND